MRVAKIAAQKILMFAQKQVGTLWKDNCNNLKWFETLGRKIVFLFLLVTGNMAFGQASAEEPAPDQHISSSRISVTKDLVKHEDLETELEIYPFNIVVPGDPVIKNEAMFDYHVYSHEDKFLGGVRFFLDANTHYKEARDMKDLIMYTEGYYGLKNFQMGVEVGSVTGEEYLSVGPQFTSYDNVVFKRVSVISRVFPDYVLGYEFTTQEVNFYQKIKVSGTGMGRVVLPSNRIVIQASLWLSLEKIKGIFLGVEYEYDNAEYFHALRYEKCHELFLGLKFELH